jgi:hypothetical protein
MCSTPRISFGGGNSALSAGDGEHRLLLDLALQFVDADVGGGDAARHRGVALGQRIDGVGDLLFGKPAHFRDHARQILEIDVESLGRVLFVHGAMSSISSGDEANRSDR